MRARTPAVVARILSLSFDPEFVASGQADAQRVEKTIMSFPRIATWVTLVALLATASLAAPPRKGDPPTLFIGGHAIEPPYTVRVEGGRVLVNGYQYYPAVRRPAAPFDSTRFSPESWARTRRQVRITRKIYDIWKSTITSRGDEDSLAALGRQRILQYAEGCRSDVRKIVFDGPTHALVYWDYGDEVDLGGEVFPFGSREYYLHPPEPEDPEEVAESRARSLRSSLDRGTVIFVDGGYRSSMPYSSPSERDSILAEIRALRQGTWVEGRLNRLNAETMRKALLDPIPLDRLRGKDVSEVDQ